MKTLKKLSAALVALALACPTVFSVSADADSLSFDEPIRTLYEHPKLAINRRFCYKKERCSSILENSALSSLLRHFRFFSKTP